MDNTIFSQFSESEQNYAISQLDPFHDTPYRLTGAPSDQSGDSVVMIVNSEKVYSASDFGLSTASGNKWDLHVSALPILNQASFYTCKLVSSTRFYGSDDDESNFVNLFPITVQGVNSGDPTFMGGYTSFSGVATTVSGYSSSTSLPFQVPRKMRVIGVSFEVVDESPTLYQQGSVTVYQSPSDCQKSAYMGFYIRPPSSGYSSKNYPVDMFNGPPNRIEQATILPSSKTWKAKEGAYVIGRRNIDCVPFERPTTSNQVLFGIPDPVNPNLRNSFVSREWFNAEFSSTDNNFFDSFNMITNYNICGAYLCGLNSEFGTYRVRQKIAYEILPDPTDSSLISLATPTLPRNPLFEKLLDESVSRLPPGVPQTSNPKGEFWKQVLGVVKKVANGVNKVAPMIGSITGLPVAPIMGVAQGVSNVASGLESLSKSKKKKPQTKVTAKKTTS